MEIKRSGSQPWQTPIVAAGFGFVQSWAGPIAAIRPGDVVFGAIASFERTERRR